MLTQTENNKRLAKNTLLLYGRMLLTVGISFYSTRLILANLGIDNYGIYNVIGGFVSMFYMVTSTMTQAVSRFLTFELGTGNKKKLQQTFSTSINILLLLSLVVVLLAETVGLWFVNYKLNISPNRMNAANWIYQFSVLSFVCEMISVPYSASVISHEKMGAFALVTILKVLLTLGIALMLSISPIDKLVFYGILVLLVSISIQLMYWIYCRKHFHECKYSSHIDKNIFKNMFGFAGWNFLTTCASMLSSQGVSILLNMHFGTAINAARGVASQVNGTVGAFSKNFTTALNPQITKSYAAQEIEYTKVLEGTGISAAEMQAVQNQLKSMNEENASLRNRVNALEEEKRNQPVVTETKASNKLPDATEYVAFFDINKAYLSEKEAVNLEAYANLIKKYPENKFIITGYADKQTGSAEFNERLSKLRAEAVYNTLVDKYGVNKDQLTMEYKGGVDTMFRENPRLSRAAIIRMAK